MTKERDFSIDFFKGITVINIVFIHTVWWSGEGYVPNIIAQLSLLVDVPLFFFLSGASATFAFHKPKPFSGIVRLMALFALFFAVYALAFEKNSVFSFFTNSLFLQYPSTSRLLIVSGSTWFIPVFIIAYLAGYLIIKHVGSKTILPLLCILFLALVYNYESIETFKSLKVFNVTPDYILCGLSFFLFGYYYYKELRFLNSFKWIASALLILSLGITLYHFKDMPFNIQGIKFPMRFFYVIASLISISLTMLLSSYIKKEYAINYMGKNALQFYLAQGIGSSLICFIVPYLHFAWPLKLAIAFILNLIITLILTVIITFIFKYCMMALAAFFAYIDNLRPSKLTEK